MLKPVFKIFFLLLVICYALHSQTIRVGAKHFNEGYILSEIISQLLENNGYKVERIFNLGGTLICFDALKNGAIDIYPEYSGTLSEEILKSNIKLNHNELNEELKKQFRLEISEPYGFNNTYALTITRNTSDKLDIHKISDLKNQTEIIMALSYEFLKRKDGWENLAQIYSLPQKPVGIEHGLAYNALVEGKIDLTDAYSTDGEIPKYKLVVLDDDKNFFPKYLAVSFYRESLDSKAKDVIKKLTGQINEQEMQEMNSEVLFAKKTFSEVASEFIKRKNLSGQESQYRQSGIMSEILQKTLEHLKLTFIALILAIIIAVPLGVLIYFYAGLSRPVLYITGLLQTIPSIALLALMIPLFGIGVVPAIAALFLYGLLPILRNTATGLFSVDPLLKKVASGIGLNKWQKLKYIELPLAMPAVFAGVRTAAIINVGTATLAAFIGAGGLGEFIVTGLALNNTELILRGAIPAALLAMLVEFIFELLEKIYLPKHLHQ